MKEVLKVYIDFRNGETKCICLRSNKGCDKKCTPEIVERDPCRGWEDTFKVDRFGKWKDSDKHG